MFVSLVFSTYLHAVPLLTPPYRFFSFILRKKFFCQNHPDNHIAYQKDQPGLNKLRGEAPGTNFYRDCHHSIASFRSRFSSLLFWWVISVLCLHLTVKENTELYIYLQYIGNKIDSSQKSTEPAPTTSNIYVLCM